MGAPTVERKPSRPPEENSEVEQTIDPVLVLEEITKVNAEAIAAMEVLADDARRAGLDAETIAGYEQLIVATSEELSRLQTTFQEQLVALDEALGSLESIKGIAGIADVYDTTTIERQEKGQAALVIDAAQKRIDAAKGHIAKERGDRAEKARVQEEEASKKVADIKQVDDLAKNGVTAEMVASALPAGAVDQFAAEQLGNIEDYRETLPSADQRVFDSLGQNFIIPDGLAADQKTVQEQLRQLEQSHDKGIIPETAYGMAKNHLTDQESGIQQKIAEARTSALASQREQFIRAHCAFAVAKTEIGKGALNFEQLAVAVAEHLDVRDLTPRMLAFLPDQVLKTCLDKIPEEQLFREHRSLELVGTHLHERRRQYIDALIKEIRDYFAPVQGRPKELASQATGEYLLGEKFRRPFGGFGYEADVFEREVHELLSETWGHARGPEEKKPIYGHPEQRIAEQLQEKQQKVADNEAQAKTLTETARTIERLQDLYQEYSALQSKRQTAFNGENPTNALARHERTIAGILAQPRIKEADLATIAGLGASMDKWKPAINETETRFIELVKQLQEENRKIQRVVFNLDRSSQDIRNFIIQDVCHGKSPLDLSKEISGMHQPNAASYALSSMENWLTTVKTKETVQKEMDDLFNKTKAELMPKVQAIRDLERSLGDKYREIKEQADQLHNLDSLLERAKEQTGEPKTLLGIALPTPRTKVERVLDGNNQIVESPAKLSRAEIVAMQSKVADKLRQLLQKVGDIYNDEFCTPFNSCIGDINAAEAAIYSNFRPSVELPYGVSQPEHLQSKNELSFATDLQKTRQAIVGTHNRVQTAISGYIPRGR